jgi:hypothetical protein
MLYQLLELLRLEHLEAQEVYLELQLVQALGTFVGELTRLYIGKNVYGLHADMDEEEFDKIARETAALSAGVDLVATPALLGLGQIIKRCCIYRS